MDCGLPNPDLRGLACGLKVMISEGKNQSACRKPHANPIISKNALKIENFWIGSRIGLPKFSIFWMFFTPKTNHPVHIQEEDGQLSPTALLPFCEFGGNMSVMGVKIDQFDVPVCNSFRDTTRWSCFRVKLQQRENSQECQLSGH